MTDKALAARLREFASLYRTFNQTGYDRSADLDRAADLIESMAQRTVIPSEDIAWVRFNAAFTDGDAPYPGMIAAFENHYGQSFADKNWRREASVWAQAWHAATRANVASPAAQRVPLTDEQIVEAFDKSLNATQFREAFAWGVTFAERHHNIRSEK